MPKYTFIRHLAEGGMGSVDLVVRVEGTFVRFHARKRLRPELRADSEVRRMFLREAEIAGLLNHPNVVSVVDVGHDEEGPFLVMDFVQGVSLSALMTKIVRERGVPPPVQVVLRICKEVALGLHAAHELVGSDGTPLELVHRDISPQNILVGYDGIARLTDFGIAKAQHLGVERTSTGLLKGKLGYLAPEQLQFERPTRRSDLFSLGVVMYEALTGQRLYSGGEPEAIARRILLEPPPDLYDARPDAHPALVELLFDLLAKSKDDRPATARDVADRIDGLLVDTLSTEAPISVGEFVGALFAGERDDQKRALADIALRTEVATRTLQQARPRWRGAAISAVALCALAVLGGGGAWMVTHAPPATDEHSLQETPRVPATLPSAPIEEPVDPPVQAELAAPPSAPPAPRARRRAPRHAHESAPASVAPAPRDPELVGWGR